MKISWFLQKLTDVDLHCLQRQDISNFSRTRVKEFGLNKNLKKKKKKKREQISVAEMHS